MENTDLTTAVQEESYIGDSFEFPFSLIGCDIELKITYPGTKQVVKMLTTADFNIENTILRFKPFIVDTPEGNYNYRLRLTVDGIKRTYLKGNWRVE